MVRLPSPVGDATRTTALRASRSPAAQRSPQASPHPLFLKSLNIFSISGQCGTYRLLKDWRSEPPS
ncbi:hypothetical protein [Nostoc sp.]|uniref:hypothetical protein n=1 Tax=Nostoc sp. TaxID=1180 RepID=UPI002FF8732A